MAVDVNALAQSFSLTGVAPGDAILGGDALSLDLVSDLPVGDSVITEVITGDVDLDLLFRHVKLPDIGSTVPDGPWPHEAVATQVIQPGTNTIPDVNVIVNDGLSSAPGAGEVEAWATTIKGSIPLGFREIEDSVQIDYRWSITDGRNPLPASDFNVLSGGLTEAALSLAFRPEVAAWTAGVSEPEDLAPTRQVCIQAEVRVRLAVTGADSGWVPVPPEPVCIDLKPLPVPEVAALFRDKNFTGDAILLMVPDDSPFGSAQEVVSVVNKLSAVVSRLNQAASLAAWATGLGGLVSAIRELAARVPTVKHLGWQKKDGNNDLGKYNFIVVNNWFDKDIEDRGSSAVAITVGRRISFYEHDDRGGKRLTLDARPSPQTFNLAGAAVADLHTAEPAVVPPGVIETSGSPGGGWGDKISSYRWEA